MEGKNLVPYTLDMIQEAEGIKKIPEIRVWTHGEGEEAGYYVFDSIKDALIFCDECPDAESHPLIAVAGYEFNLFAIKQRRLFKRKK